MATSRDLFLSFCTAMTKFHTPPALPVQNLHRAASDLSFVMRKEATADPKLLPPVAEVEEIACECCGMAEECTPGYIHRVRDQCGGRWLCGLCSEAVKEECARNGGAGKEEALQTHMSMCVRFNRVGKAQPVIGQAKAMREMLKRNKGSGKKGGIVRSSSCIPALMKEMD